MKKTIFILLLFLFYISVFSDTKQNKIQSLFNYLYNNNMFNGNVLVENNGEILFQKSFGIANAEWNIPNTTKSKFEIGSVTKQFTAMVILQLNEEGKLNLNAKLGDFLLEIAEQLWGDKTMYL